LICVFCILKIIKKLYIYFDFKSDYRYCFETARVEEVIGDFVQLKRAGSNFKGLSPFSDERSPSLWFRQLKEFGKILVLKGEFCCFDGT
jgi:hypothetical protein